MNRDRWKISQWIVLALLAQVGAVPSAPGQVGAPSAHVSLEALTQELGALRAQFNQQGESAALYMQLGEVLRKLGRSSEASRAYLRAGQLDPTMYVSFHQLSITCEDADMLDEVAVRLQKLSLEKPKELMLRVALSEILEKRQKYYEAARTLIDITYANAVPEKFRPKVNARIHYLLAQSRNAHQQRTETASNEEELDIVPAPLPAPPTKRSLAAAKIRDAREVKAVGKVPLLQ